MKIKIDQKKLFEMDACEEGIIDFNKTFPEGVELDTEKTYVFEEDHKYVEWLFKKLKISFKTPLLEIIVKDNLVHHKNSIGHDYWYEYDKNGNLVQRKDSDGYEYWEEYDDNGNEIHHKNSNGYEEWNTYDENNNLIHHKNSNGYEYWEEYDENNNLIHHKDCIGYEYSGKILKFDYKII